MHVMLDLETLGVRPDAAIIQVGAVLFEAKSGGKILNGKGFNDHVLLQDGAGTVDHGTVAWWLLNRSSEAMGNALSTKANPLNYVLEKFLMWPKDAADLSWDAIEGVWSKGADFDLPILQSAYARLGMIVPWNMRAGRCVRTLFALTGGEPEIDWTGMAQHDAFDDAVGQAMQVQKAMGVFQ